MTAELAFPNEDDALQVASILMRADYCVLLSKEEDLTIINYEYSENADRNGVVFMSAEEHYNEQETYCKDCPYKEKEQC